MNITELFQKRPELRAPALTAVLALAIVAGALGPWVAVSSPVLQRSSSLAGVDTMVEGDPSPWLVSSGTFGPSEGVAVIALAVLGVGMAAGSAFAARDARRPLALLSAGAFALAATIAMVDWITIQRFLSSSSVDDLLRLANAQSGQDLRISVRVGWGLWSVAAGSIACAAVATQMARSLGPAGFAAPAPAAAAIRRAALELASRGSGRLGVVEPGRSAREIAVRDGERLVVGRSAGAQVRVEDARVSRQHLEIQYGGGAWTVADLGATNRARLYTDGAQREIAAGERARVGSGQVAIGGAVLTLYPAV